MMHLTFENDMGHITLSGGRSAEGWRVLDIDGLALPEKSLNTAVYPSQPGQTTLSETVGARTITLQCDVRTGNNGRSALSKALKILNEPGTLIIAANGMARKIEARCTDAAPGECHGGYQVFALQFVCDNPYFEDRSSTTVPIYRVQKLIGSGTRYYQNNSGTLQTEAIDPNGFKLPGLLSKRISEAVVYNMGDVETDPVIMITMQGNAKAGSLCIYKDKGDKGEKKLELTFPIAVRRRTDGTTQEISYIPKNGDIITIDISGRRIYNQDGDNLLSGLALTDFLGDFQLDRGKNMIQVENKASNACTVVCRYSNKYVEAVIA